MRPAISIWWVQAACVCFDSCEGAQVHWGVGGGGRLAPPPQTGVDRASSWGSNSFTCELRKPPTRYQVSGNRSGSLPAATLLGPQLQPELPALSALRPMFPATLNCLSPCRADASPPAWLGLLSPFAPQITWQPPTPPVDTPRLPVYTSVTTLRFAHGFVFPSVSFLKVGAECYSAKCVAWQVVGVQ